MPSALFDLTGKTCWVTGAASGIGRETALTLACQGASVIASDLNLEGAEATAQACGDALALAHDVSAEAAWATCAAAVKDRFGKLDVLVNNAGIMMSRSFSEAPVEILRRQNRINVESVYLGMQTVEPLMKTAIAQGAAGASIVNVASIYGKVAGAQFAAYSATKGAVRALSKAVAYEWASAGIRVNCVLPGPVQTNLGADWEPPLDAEGNPIPPEVALAAWASLIPMKRLGVASDVAPMIAYLASDAAAFVTGAEFTADGGYTAA
ncbi:SDR family NAD(P)-dependent oxidoreductase [Sphingomonas sp. LH128]|uniref:SDR family NAD(P)-dependent oxidoreductase n=1 Tax=Sphingomonas sp. LH128 TaxID=473781 RepID=UPI0002D2B65D|nr:SDR family oxidoreductase [Sphingomonas sp. LH128]